ncbi:MAG: N-acetylglucosamine kinase [Clostridia bacterium]|nr:N-acetylglucosamine kinase [Clostridia bacterium]
MQELNDHTYVLGIDSGGTKYLVRAAAPDGRLLGEYRGPCCSHYRFPEEEAKRRIAENIARCLETFGGRPGDCAALVCGTTGYDSPEDGELLQRMYTGLAGFHCPVRVMNDVEIAFHTACGSEGVLMLAGTGSICYGINSRGEAVRVGGWPSGVFGDEGSGRYIDALALRHFSRYMDGRRLDSPLLREIEEVTRVKTRKQLMDYAVSLGQGAIPTPGLGPAVTRAASAGDPYAEAILRDAAHCLSELAAEVILALYPEDCADIPVGIWGSVLIQSLPLRGMFWQELKARFPGARLLVPDKDAAQGAVEMAVRIARTGKSGMQG